MPLNRLSGPILIHIRCASSSSSFPFPSHAQPTPHQIFHLPLNASQQDIKRRYYDLVRVHHPDSPACRSVSSADRTVRFQAIVAAYDQLTGKTPRLGSKGYPDFGEYADELARRQRARDRARAYRHQREPYTQPPRYEWESNADDRWKDRMILTFGVVALAIGIAPGFFLLPYQLHHSRHLNAVKSYSEVRIEAEEEAEGRRKGIRNRLQEIKDESRCD